MTTGPPSPTRRLTMAGLRSSGVSTVVRVVAIGAVRRYRWPLDTPTRGVVDRSRQSGASQRERSSPGRGGDPLPPGRSLRRRASPRRNGSLPPQGLPVARPVRSPRAAPPGQVARPSPRGGVVPTTDPVSRRDAGTGSIPQKLDGPPEATSSASGVSASPNASLSRQRPRPARTRVELAAPAASRGTGGRRASGGQRGRGGRRGSGGRQRLARPGRHR